MRVTQATPVTVPTLDYFEEASNDIAGDPATQVAVMMLKHAKESRQISQQQTRLEEAQLRQSQQDQVKALKAQAEQIRAAGFVKGFSMMLSGALTAVAAEPGGSTKKVLEGSAKYAEGVGTLGSSLHDGNAKSLEADAIQFDHQSGESERRLQDLQEQRAHLKDLKRAALEHLRSVEETEANIDRTITSWRA